MNSQQYFVFLKDLFNRFIHSSWQCVCAHESGIGKEEWEVYASQCVVKGNNHITWLFPQYFSYMKVVLRVLRHV